MKAILVDSYNMIIEQIHLYEDQKDYFVQVCRLLGTTDFGDHIIEDKPVQLLFDRNCLLDTGNFALQIVGLVPVLLGNLIIVGWNPSTRCKTDLSEAIAVSVSEQISFFDREVTEEFRAGMRAVVNDPLWRKTLGG